VTNAPQLVNDMMREAARLEARAKRLKDRRRKRIAVRASTALREAIASLAAAAAIEGDE
jgi:hypothetical protein